MIAIDFAQAVTRDVAATSPGMWVAMGSLAALVGYNLRETVGIGKKVTTLCERFVHTPTTRRMKDEISDETRAIRNEVTSIVSDVQLTNFKHADEIENIKIKCAKRHGDNGVI